MIDPITIAMALSQFVPQIIRWVGGGDKAVDAAETVINIAKKVTGKDSGEAALEELKVNPDKVLAFRQHIIDNETELDRMYLADVQSARDREVKLAQAGKRNYRADTMYILAVTAVGYLVYIVLTSPDMNEYAKGIVTLALGRFLGYLDQIYNYEWGTTRQSRNKDDTIKALSGR